MRIKETLQYACAWLACLGVLSPTAIFGAAPEAQTATHTVKDVELSATGCLTGQVLDQQGNGLAGVTVSLLQQGQPAGQAVSAANGSFAIDNLTGGTFQMIAGNQVNSCRAWTATTAPPAATDGVLLVLPASVVRGQQPAYSSDTYGQLPAPAAQGQVMQGQMMQGQVVQGQPVQGEAHPARPGASALRVQPRSDCCRAPT